MNAHRRRKTFIILLIGSAIAVASYLVLYALRSNINLFYTPSQIHDAQVSKNQTIRLGGMVVKNSVNKSTSGNLHVSFELSDGVKSVRVEYSGILPDLFREGQGIVAMGQLGENGVFIASQVLAKHDENYMPPEIKSSMRVNQ